MTCYEAINIEREHLIEQVLLIYWFDRLDVTKINQILSSITSIKFIKKCLKGKLGIWCDELRLLDHLIEQVLWFTDLIGLIQPS